MFYLRLHFKQVSHRRRRRRCHIFLFQRVHDWGKINSNDLPAVTLYSVLLFVQRFSDKISVYRYQKRWQVKPSSETVTQLKIMAGTKGDFYRTPFVIRIEGMGLLIQQQKVYCKILQQCFEKKFYDL